jgi:hypothetical protein
MLAYAPQVVHDALEESVACYVRAVQLFDRLETLKVSGEEITEAKRVGCNKSEHCSTS